MWDLLLGLTLLVVAVPAGAATLGLPANSLLTTVVLVVVGVGSLAYALVLARAARHADAAEAICASTAVANAVGVVALLAILVTLRQELTVAGTTIAAVAAVGCAAFAGAEWSTRPLRKAQETRST